MSIEPEKTVDSAGNALPAPFESADLVARYQAGDETAANRIFERYVTRLTALARSRLSVRLAARVDPEDIVLSAYRSFFIGLRGGNFHLERGGDLWRLLVEITLHKLYRQAAHHTALRRAVDAEKAVPIGEVELAATLSRAPQPSEVQATIEELEWLMRQLPPSGRRVIELRLQGMRHDEIAADVCCSERTVRRMLQRAQEWMENRRNECE